MCFGCVFGSMIAFTMFEIKVMALSGFLWSRDCFVSFLWPVSVDCFRRKMIVNTSVCSITFLSPWFDKSGETSLVEYSVRLEGKNGLQKKCSSLHYSIARFLDCFWKYFPFILKYDNHENHQVVNLYTKWLVT